MFGIDHRPLLWGNIAGIKLKLQPNNIRKMYNIRCFFSFLGVFINKQRQERKPSRERRSLEEVSFFQFPVNILPSNKLWMIPVYQELLQSRPEIVFFQFSYIVHYLRYLSLKLCLLCLARFTK